MKKHIISITALIIAGLLTVSCNNSSENSNDNDVTEYNDTNNAVSEGETEESFDEITDKSDDIVEEVEHEDMSAPEDVKIIIHEGNSDGAVDDEYKEWLAEQSFHPGISLDKHIWVENKGNNPAYVRLYIAIPYAARDIVTVDYGAYYNNGWSSDVSKYDKKGEDLGDGYFVAEINGEEYLVRCLTYLHALEPGFSTLDAMKAVTMNKETECSAITDGSVVYSVGDSKYSAPNGQIPIQIISQAVHMLDTDPYMAFNETFGEYNISPWG